MPFNICYLRPVQRRMGKNVSDRRGTCPTQAVVDPYQNTQMFDFIDLDFAAKDGYAEP